MNILKKANEIVSERSEEKERMYGPFFETMRRATAIYNLLSPATPMETVGMYKAMVAMKLAREAYHHKEDNLLDACAYMGSMNDYIETDGATDFVDLVEDNTAEDTKIITYFGKPISECSDSDLIYFYIAFCEKANPENPRHQRDYEVFKAEVPKRSKSFQAIIARIDSIL